jgi:CDP-6-deoxy-D-xylo-4-hexulose-3-dehydrase
MSNISLDWKLATSSFTALDKFKIGLFLFREPMWTYGSWVRKYEQMWEKQFGVKRAIMVSSGSTANELIALRRKWELQQAGEWPRRNKVVCPVNTWISSVSPWINHGFEVVFTDVAESNLNMDERHLAKAFADNPDGSIATVFYTALLGWVNDLEKCKEIAESHNARFLMDNCEASFSSHGSLPSILTFATCSTSIFFSHFTSSGTEGGLIFTESQEEAEWYLMARSHGLTRGMPEKYKNPNVHPDFDFYLFGSNYRSSNLQAYMAGLDFDRALKFSMENRRQLFNRLNEGLNPVKYHHFETAEDAIPLAAPILCRTKEEREKAEAALKVNGVMTRPLIGGCLLAHTAFKGYGNIDDFPVAKWSHNCGFYIGLNPTVTPKMIDRAVKILNESI